MFSKGIRHLYDRINTRFEDKDPNVALIAVSIVANFLMTITKVGFGIFLASGWLLINACYFMFIGMVRYFIMRKYIFSKTIEDPHTKYNFDFNIHKISGSLVFATGATYALACARMFMVGDVIVISGIFVYYIVIFTICKILFAIYGLIITRSKENLIIRTMKVVGAVDAFVAIGETSYALFSMYSYKYSAQVSSIIGMFTSLCIMISGYVMLKRRKISYREIEAIRAKKAS